MLSIISGEVIATSNHEIPASAGRTTTPEIAPNWALFLDIDGTLLDFAATPSKVSVPGELQAALVALRKSLGGALAIVSGRTLSSIDHLFPGWNAAAGAEHGAVVRLPDGELDELPALAHPPSHWLAQIRAAAAEWPGVLIETKAHTIAVHYRLAPARQPDILKLLTGLVLTDASRFEVLVAHQALEIRPRGITKARAVNLLMATEPFRSRIPVYVGDDITDEDGMMAAQRRGGLALHVNVHFSGKPAQVRHWIYRAAARLRGTI